MHSCESPWYCVIMSRARICLSVRPSTGETSLAEMRSLGERDEARETKENVRLFPRFAAWKMNTEIARLTYSGVSGAHEQTCSLSFSEKPGNCYFRAAAATRGRLRASSIERLIARRPTTLSSAAGYRRVLSRYPDESATSATNVDRAVRSIKRAKGTPICTRRLSALI